MNALIVNQFENGDTINSHSDNVVLSSKGKADDLHSGTVVTVTLHATGVFLLEPNTATRADLGMRKQNYNLSVPGRVAVLSHPGDVVVMAGGAMRSHIHGTLKVSEWPELHKKKWRCIDFEDDDQRMTDPDKTARYSLALRSNRYHSNMCPRKSNEISQYGDTKRHLKHPLHMDMLDHAQVWLSQWEGKVTCWRRFFENINKDIGRQRETMETEGDRGDRWL